jgi:hypothetical protein
MMVCGMPPAAGIDRTSLLAGMWSAYIEPPSGDHPAGVSSPPLTSVSDLSISEITQTPAWGSRFQYTATFLPSGEYFGLNG